MNSPQYYEELPNGDVLYYGDGPNKKKFDRFKGEIQKLKKENKRLEKRMAELEKRVMEMELAPPQYGGTLYRQAKQEYEHYEQRERDNDLKPMY